MKNLIIGVPGSGSFQPAASEKLGPPGGQGGRLQLQRRLEGRMLAKCGFQIGGRGRQTKKKSADLRDPTLFFSCFQRMLGSGCFLPLSLRACLRLSEMTTQRHTVGFLRLLPLIRISSPKQRSVVKVRQGFQGISGDSGEILFISERTPFSFPRLPSLGF